MVNFPFFGVVCFWAQFAFLAVSLVVLVTAMFRTPKLNDAQVDEDAEAEEEEGLLSSVGRRLDATREDITGKSRSHTRGYGAAGREGRATDAERQ
jgi:LMBR1 domain-containing protein 1